MGKRKKKEKSKLEERLNSFSKRFDAINSSWRDLLLGLSLFASCIIFVSGAALQIRNYLLGMIVLALFVLGQTIIFKFPKRYIGLHFLFIIGACTFNIFNPVPVSEKVQTVSVVRDWVDVFAILMTSSSFFIASVSLYYGTIQFLQGKEAEVYTGQTKAGEVFCITARENRGFMRKNIPVMMIHNNTDAPVYNFRVYRSYDENSKMFERNFILPGKHVEEIYENFPEYQMNQLLTVIFTDSTGATWTNHGDGKVHEDTCYEKH